MKHLIESAWARYLKAIGWNLMDEICTLMENSTYNGEEDWQKQLLQYILIPIVQSIVDRYAIRVNSKMHRKTNSRQEYVKVRELESETGNNVDNPITYPVHWDTIVEYFGIRRCRIWIQSSVIVI